MSLPGSSGLWLLAIREEGTNLYSMTQIVYPFPRHWAIKERELQWGSEMGVTQRGRLSRPPPVCRAFSHILI